MKTLTVPFPVSTAPIRESDLANWANAEAQKIFRQVRDALNLETLTQDTVTTGGAGAYARLWTSEALPTNGVWMVAASVAGVTIASAGAFRAAGYRLIGLFQSAAGTVAQVGATTAVSSIETTGATDARFGVDAANRQIYLEARDDGANAMRFLATMSIEEALQA